MKTLNKRYLFLIMVVSIVLGLFIAQDYLLTIMLALTFGFIFRPLYVKLLKNFGNRSTLAMVVTTVIFLLIILLPLIIIGSISFREMKNLVQALQQANSSSNFDLTTIANELNKVLANFNLTISAAEINTAIKETAQTLITVLFQNLSKIGSSLLNFFPQLFIFISFFTLTISRLDHLLLTIKKISPLPENVDELYFSRIFEMAKSMITGTLLIAIIQGICTALILKIVGVDYVFFLGILATIFSIIPLGTGFIVWPIAIAEIILGNLPAGIFLILVNTIFISNIDNLLRPKLVSKNAELRPAYVLLGVLGGLSTFGFLGILIGPIVMIFAQTSLEVYLKHFSNK